MQYGSVKAKTLCQSQFFNEPQTRVRLPLGEGRKGRKEREEREEREQRNA
ncbi:hypothetical protein LC605_13965 [Nostoc sp. CHAB 5836]|nr:hypothetical protein [Nostoc sp. CHAB 5836]